VGGRGGAGASNPVSTGVRKSRRKLNPRVEKLGGSRTTNKGKKKKKKKHRRGPAQARSETWSPRIAQSKRMTRSGIKKTEKITRALGGCTEKKVKKRICPEAG